MDGATPQEKTPITLANLLLAVPIIVLTIVAAKNLPGLLEIALLQHLPFENAARYAITTTSCYAIIVLGICLTFNSIGVRWASVQWLVAALGVGLGFGLQEIFANFVSGLILLFEQPIRVGDVITLGDTTGSVSRIRMRATTITNWDRQELIIPNKDLITGKLLNWTLTDSTNRIVITIGIAYRSDTDRACQVVLKLCNEHPSVMRSPQPTVTFEAIRESSLEIKARVFVETLDVRLQTQHDLHTSIHRMLVEEGIELAYPQRDIHFKSVPESILNTLKRD